MGIASDADERMTDALAEEIGYKARNAVGFNSFRIAGKIMLFDQFIPNCTSYPIYQVSCFVNQKDSTILDMGKKC